MVLPPSLSRKMGEIETVEAEKMGWLVLPPGTSYPTFPYISFPLSLMVICDTRVLSVILQWRPQPLRPVPGLFQFLRFCAVRAEFFTEAGMPAIFEVVYRGYCVHKSEFNAKWGMTPQIRRHVPTQHSANPTPSPNPSPALSPALN